MRSIYLFVIAWTLTAGVGAVMIIDGPSPIWWIGAGLILATIAHASTVAAPSITRTWAQLSQPRTLAKIEYRPSTVLTEVAIFIAFLTLAAVIMPEAALGDRPIDHDHTVHYTKAWRLQHHFLSQGRLIGWSEQWFAGYPAQYLYPIGADLWVVLINVFTLGLLGFSGAYGVGVYLFWALQGWAVYLFSRAGFSRTTGVLAGMLLMSDTGTFRFGGWVYSMKWAVWPQLFATALAMIALSKLPEIARRGHTWQIGFFSLFAGLALISHPAMLLFLACAAISAILALWLSPSIKERLSGLVQIGFGFGLAGLIGAMWLLPFLSVRKSSTPYGMQWNTAESMGIQLYSLDIFPGTWAPIVALGLLGLISVLASRRFSHTFVGLFTIILLTASSSTFLSQLHLTDLLDSLTFVQFQRFSMMVKPLWYLLAAYSAVGALSHANTWLKSNRDDDKADETTAETPSSWREHGLSLSARLLLIMTLCAPVIFHFGYTWSKQHLARELTEASTRPYKADRASFIAWAKQNMKVDPKQRARMLIKTSKHDHSFVDLGTEIDIPIYKTGFTPAATYKFKPESDNPTLLAALNVRWVLSVGRKQSKKDYTFLKSFGRLHLYELETWSPEPFEIISGEGDVEVISLSEEKQVFRAKPGADGVIRFNTSSFPRWSIKRDGVPLEITPVRVINDEKTGFMSTPLAPGEYVLEFERRGLDHLAKLIGLVGFLIAMLLLCSSLAPLRTSRGFELLDRLGSKLRELDHSRPIIARAIGIVGVGVCLIGAVMLGSWTPKISKTHRELARKDNATPVYDLAENLSNATVFIERNGAMKRCQRATDAHFCGGYAWEDIKIHSFIDERDKVWRRCIWAHPRPDSTVVLQFDDIPSGAALRGYYGIGLFKKSGGPVDIAAFIDGQEVFTGETTRDGEFETIDVELENDGSTHQLQLRVSAKETGKRHFCINAQITK